MLRSHHLFEFFIDFFRLPFPVLPNSALVDFSPGDISNRIRTTPLFEFHLRQVVKHGQTGSVSI
jgi:hypothetical protein